MGVDLFHVYILRRVVGKGGGDDSVKKGGGDAKGTVWGKDSEGLDIEVVGLLKE